MGGRVLLSEVPEMFGAEQVLMDRATSARVFEEEVAMVNDFKRTSSTTSSRCTRTRRREQGGRAHHARGEVARRHPEGGRAPVTDVRRYGAAVRPESAGGLTLVEAPGNDGVSCTADDRRRRDAALFTTGRGTPLGFPVPTVKVSSNSDIARKKPHWIDFDAGGS
jgi:altronate hydrolase